MLIWFTFFDKYIYCVSDWTAVKLNVKIPWDLEATSLQIMTDSLLRSDEQILARIAANDSKYIGYVGMEFSSSMRYYIGSCMTIFTDLPVQPPVEVDKIWTITKTETAFIITCNNMEVLNYLFADSSRSDCVSKYVGDVVEEIRFYSGDTASDFYKAGKGLNST